MHCAPMSITAPMANHDFVDSLYGANSFNTMAQSDASRTLFLGDLSYFCTEEDLCSLFFSYGRITNVRVRRGVTGESLMHGFVALESSDAALKAIRDLDGSEFMGRNMRVQLSSDGQRPNPVVKESFVQVHVSFISKQINRLICERVLRELFSPFGRIADVTIKKHTLVPKQNRQSGYGFVYFFDVDAATHAMNVLKHNTVHEITLDCSISHKSLHDKPYPHNGHHNGSHNRMHPPMTSIPIQRAQAAVHPAMVMSTNGQWDINAPDTPRSFSALSMQSSSSSVSRGSSSWFSSGYPSTQPAAMSEYSHGVRNGGFASAGLVSGNAGLYSQAQPRANLYVQQTYGNASSLEPTLSLLREREMAIAREQQQQQRVYTSEELEAELARMSLALHNHYQERELEREREMAYLAHGHAMLSSEWEDNHAPFLPIPSFRAAPLPLPSSHASLQHTTNFGSVRSLSSLSLGSAVSPRQSAQSHKQLSRHDSFYNEGDQVMSLNTFSMSELDQLIDDNQGVARSGNEPFDVPFPQTYLRTSQQGSPSFDVLSVRSGSSQ